MAKIRFLAVTAYLTFLMVSCGTSDRLVKSHNLKKILSDNTATKPPIYLPGKPVYIHDTVKTDIRHMTQAEYQAFLQKFYENNFDKLISPEFRRIAANNKVLTGLMREMFKQDIQLRIRTRKFRDSVNQHSDSVAIKSQQKVDSANNVANERQAIILKNSQDAARDNAATAKDTKNIIWILGGLTFLIIITLMFVYKKVSKLGKKVEALEKTLLSHE